MCSLAVPHLDRQARDAERVNLYFQDQSSYWTDIYADKGVQAEIYRNRTAAVLDWIDDLALAPGSRVLEIGCGAGFLAVALARRGFCVSAIDSTEVMVELTRRHAGEAGTIELLSVGVGDAHALAFEDRTFNLVVAVGVIPWVQRPDLALQEMARVTKPGGYVILTADNRARLTYLLDPQMHPAVGPLKRRAKEALARLGLRRSPDAVAATFHDCSCIDTYLAGAALIKTRARTLGFGPFSLFRRRVLPEPLGTTLHHRLQRLAERGVPIVRSTGAHYLVLASKTEGGRGAFPSSAFPP